MKQLIASIAVVFALSSLPTAYAADGKSAPDKSMEEADKAAKSMVSRIYIYDPVTPKLPSAVMSKLKELGYTNIHDFDIEYGQYEIEAKEPGGNDVEISVDPISGAIIDIDDNWF